MYQLSDYDYRLPPELIAQRPANARDRSRLLLLQRDSGEVSHHRFADVAEFLQARDVLVINDTAVIPGRLFGRKETGGKVEVLLLDYAGGRSENGRFFVQCLVKASKPPRSGGQLIFGPDLSAQVISGAKGVYTLAFAGKTSFHEQLRQVGQVPLPPYIRRDSTQTHSGAGDRHDYQTVYAAHPGAIAAPTAGLHFSESLLAKIAARGIDIVRLTLHVGYGTFLPVRASDVRQHRMHAERFVLSPDAAERINRGRSSGGRVVAVGTTSVRTLEHLASDEGRMLPGEGACDLFIYPGYRFKVVDALVTNFHLPRSTLLMLVSAFAGREKVLQAYRVAVEERYRFYSYGDAMFIA
jgi:S-adenosylmethionine:tRNA ribosyltransferase-isomerase